MSLNSPSLPAAPSALPLNPPTRRRRFAVPTALAAASCLVLAGCATAPSTEATGAAAAAAAPKPVAAAPAPAAAPTPAATAAAGAAVAPVAGVAAPRPAAATAVASGPAGAASAPAARPDQPPLRAFADVIRTAKRSEGFFGIWREDEKLWIEIPEDRFGKPFHLSINVRNAVGERGLYGATMGEDHTAEFRKIGRTVQLVLKNTDFRAEGDAAMARTVRESFSDSLLAAGTVASAPHPERKSVLVDATFLLADLLGYGTAVENAFRLPYGLDRANSYFDHTRTTERMSSVGAQLHFATPRIPAPPLTPPPFPVPPPPRTLPDARSFFVGVTMNFTALPEQPMARRMADPRLGYFTESFTDYSVENKANNRVHLITRWRLEKKDPNAAMSLPVKPITYWLDRNIPQRYRAAVAAGVLEWNKAFERIGFKEAVVVQQQADNAEFDLSDSEHASIRWFTGADVGFARGPSHRDPRSGEILDADIQMSDVFGRGARRLILEDVGAGTAARAAAMGQAMTQLGRRADANFCTYGDEKAAEMGFALDLLESRGDLTLDSPEAEAFVMAAIKDTIMHEVGHTLGLRHNFRASTTVTAAQLRDKAWTQANGTAASVMDYNPYNVPLKGETLADASNPTLGAYDYWAIEYGYRPLPAGSEVAELAKIAGRSTEPQLAYADDRDAGGFGPFEGLDPRDSRFDQGDDPLAWAERRMKLSRELWERVQERGLKAGDEVERPRRSLMAGLRQIGALPGNVAKYIGGMYAERDLPGTGARAAFRPVESAKQRQALNFLTGSFFSSDSFRFKPEFLSSLGADYVEWDRNGPVSVPQLVLGLQRGALDRILAAGPAQRLLDLPFNLPEKERASAISLSEVYQTLQDAVWSELQAKPGATGAAGANAAIDIDPLRRNLQREHLKRVQAMLTRPAPNLPADALSLVRLQAGQLQAVLKAANARRSANVETRAHLADSLGSLNEALKATMQRQ